MISSSTRLSLTGRPTDWTRKTSFSRTFSLILAKLSSLLNLKTSQSPSLSPRYEQISLASAGWEFPVKTFRSSNMGMAAFLAEVWGERRHCSTAPCPTPYLLRAQPHAAIR